MGLFDWFRGGKKVSKAQVVSEKDAPVVLAKAGFKCYAYIIDGVCVAGIDKKPNGNVYEVYKSGCRATAMKFLSAIPTSAIPPLHYVIVETPEGNVGKDVRGTFDEPN
jgi:hypothetical protein